MPSRLETEDFPEGMDRCKSLLTCVIRSDPAQSAHQTARELVSAIQVYRLGKLIFYLNVSIQNQLPMLILWSCEFWTRRFQ